MGRKRTEPLKKQPVKLYIGMWIARLGRKPGEVATAIGITPQFMSELIKGSKKPSTDTLFHIADELGIPAQALRHPPPPPSAAQAIAGLTPEALERLSKTRRN